MNIVTALSAALAGVAARAGSSAAQQERQPPAPARQSGGESLGQRLEGDVGRASKALGGAHDAGALASVLGWLHGTDSSAIQAGKLAQEKGTSGIVKRLGSKLVSDHTAVEQEVAAFASARGVPAPTGGARSTAAGLSPLQKLEGKAFDGAFLKWVAGQQRRDAAEAKNAQANAQRAGDPLLAGLLGKLAPKLESHVRSAQAAQRSGTPERQARTPPPSR